MAQKYKKDSCWHRFLLEITFSNVPPEKLVKYGHDYKPAPSKHTKESLIHRIVSGIKTRTFYQKFQVLFDTSLQTLSSVPEHRHETIFLNQMKESVPLPNSHTLNVLFSFRAAKGDLLKHDTHLYQKDPHIHVLFLFQSYLILF
nr:MAG TPA: hypothetical protein [Caudoviricetes sp.]